MAQNKIITFNDARQMAQNIVQKEQNNQIEKQNAFEVILSEIQKINPSMGGLDEIAVLLGMPEEQFNILAPVFLNELEKNEDIYLNKLGDKAKRRIEKEYTWDYIVDKYETLFLK